MEAGALEQLLPLLLPLLLLLLLLLLLPTIAAIVPHLRHAMDKDMMPMHIHAPSTIKDFKNFARQDNLPVEVPAILLPPIAASTVPWYRRALALQ